MKAIRRLLGPLVERGSFRLAAALSARPRRAVGLVLVVVTLSLLMTPTAPAVADDGCGGGITGLLCSGSHKVGLGNLWDTADSTMSTINALSPTNFLDTWAQGLCSAVVFVLAFIEVTAEKLGTPAYDQQWWATQYAVSFGLSMIVFAFLMLFITAKIGTSDGSVSGIELLRKSGIRVIFVFPACMAAPAVLYSVQQVAAQLTRTFAAQSEQDGHGAIGALMTYLKQHAGDWGNFGGTILVIFMMFFVLLTSIVLLIEVAVSNWGLTLAGLLVPFGIVAAAYPPWAKVLKRLSIVIGTLMFTPVFVFFFFWTIWSALNSFATSDDSSNRGFTMVLFLLVSLIMIDAFPLVAVWLLGLTAPDMETMDPNVRDMAPTPTGGEVYSGMFDRQFTGGGTSDGDGAGGGGGGGPAADADPVDEPEVGDGSKGGDGGGPAGGGSSGGLNGAAGGAEGAAGGAEAGAASGAEAGAVGGSEAGPVGTGVGAGLGAAAGMGAELGQSVQDAPDDIHSAGDDMVTDDDGGGR